MLSRKHYRKFAEILKVTPTLSDFVEQVIVYFRHDNPRFDEVRFRKACGRNKYDN